MRACVRACVRSCVRACVRACVRTCVWRGDGEFWRDNDYARVAENHIRSEQVDYVKSVKRHIHLTELPKKTWAPRIENDSVPIIVILLNGNSVIRHSAKWNSFDRRQHSIHGRTCN